MCRRWSSGLLCQSRYQCFGISSACKTPLRACRSIGSAFGMLWYVWYWWRYWWLYLYISALGWCAGPREPSKDKTEDRTKPLTPSVGCALLSPHPSLVCYWFWELLKMGTTWGAWSWYWQGKACSQKGGWCCSWFQKYNLFRSSSRFLTRL